MPVQQLHRRPVEVNRQAWHADLAGLRVDLWPVEVEHDRRGDAVDADKDHRGVQPMLGSGVEDGGRARWGPDESRTVVRAGLGRDMGAPSRGQGMRKRPPQPRRVETGASDQMRFLAATTGPVLRAVGPPFGGPSRGQGYCLPV